jgi:hypothetical protein
MNATSTHPAVSLLIVNETAVTKSTLLLRIQQAARLIEDLGKQPDHYLMGRVKEVWEIFEAEDAAGRDTTMELSIINHNLDMLIDKAYSDVQ